MCLKLNEVNLLVLVFLPTVLKKKKSRLDNTINNNNIREKANDNKDHNNYNNKESKLECSILQQRQHFSFSLRKRKLY
jgi:hypothetical protein